MSTDRWMDKENVGGVCVCMCVYVYHIFIHSSVSGHLGCFRVLAFRNSVAINIGVHVSFQIMIFSEYMAKSGIAGPYGSSVFNFGRKRHTVLPRGCTSVHSHPQVGGSLLHTLTSICSLYTLWWWSFCGVGWGATCTVSASSQQEGASQVPTMVLALPFSHTCLFTWYSSWFAAQINYFHSDLCLWL